MTNARFCPACGQRIIIAYTAVPGAPMRLDSTPNHLGSIAARHEADGTWTARRLRQGRRPPRPPEHVYALHELSCRPPQPELPGIAT